MDDKTFESAQYYDCCDDEQLEHTTPIEAIVAYIENNEPESIQEVRVMTVVVSAYTTEPVGHSWISARGTWSAERFTEWFRTEFCGDAGDGGFTAVEEVTLASDLTQLFARHLEAKGARQYRFVGTRIYSPDELEAIAREHMAEWFEETKGVVGDETV